MPQKINDQIAFEKARYEYCLKLYEKEVERSDAFEKRIQFYFSFITLVLGGIFLSLDYFEKIKDLIYKTSPPIFIVNTIYFSTIIIGLALLSSLLSIFAFTRIRYYARKQPENLVTALFSPESKYLDSKTEKDFYKATALSYAIALEVNIKLTNQQVVWVQLSSLFNFISVLSLLTLMTSVAYLYSIS